MAATMAQMPSTPGAGPSSSPISRTTSSSSHVLPDDAASDSEEEWLGPFRADIERQQEERRRDLLRDVEVKYQQHTAALIAKYSPTGTSAGLHRDVAYLQAKAQLDRSYEAQKQKVARVLEEEKCALIEDERGIRKLSMGGQLDPEEKSRLVQRQEELLKQYEVATRAQRSDSTSPWSNEKTSQPSSSPQAARRPVPPARPISSQKSTTSQTSSLSRDSRTSSTISRAKPSLADDLFSKRSQHNPQKPGSNRYFTWGDDFPAPFEISEEPEEISDRDSDAGEEEDGPESDGREGEDNESEDESKDSDDGLSILGDFMYSVERNFVRTAPVDIVRGGAGSHQPSTRGRARLPGRTTPVIPSAYASTTTTPLKQPSQSQTTPYKNNDAHHRLWKPSQENIRQPPLNRRPSIIDSSIREQEEGSDMRRRSGSQSIHARQASGLSRGAPGTSASPPSAAPSTSFGASSAAAFAQQRPPETPIHPPQIWRPPENKSSTPVISNEHVYGSSTRTSGWTAPNNSPTASTHPYRTRNDSDTSTGSVARRASQPHSQSFSQAVPSPRASLPVNTPGMSTARRSPIPVPESYSTPSPPISSPPSTSVNRRSPMPPRASSPPPIPILTGSSRASLSRQPTEVVEPTPLPVRERTPSKVYSRATGKSRAPSEPPEPEVSTSSSASGSLSERVRNSPSASALSEQMAKQRDRASEIDREHKKRKENIEREGEELRRREILQKQREAELSARISEDDDGDDDGDDDDDDTDADDVVVQKDRVCDETERELRDRVQQEHRAETEKQTRALRDLQAKNQAQEARFSEQARVLEEQRTREAELRERLELELASKEAELSRHKREMEQLQLRNKEREIAEQTRQLEMLKKREVQLEEQQRLLEEQRALEMEQIALKNEELQMKLEELRRRQEEFREEQRRKEEREREEAKTRKEEEERQAERRRKEEQLRAAEEELKQKEREIYQREEALAHRRKEEELRAKEEALERQRRELQAREEELARREEEEARRKAEERKQREKDMQVRRQREDEDKKRNEERVQRRLAQEKEREEMEREAKLRELREREEKEREDKKRNEERVQRKLAQEKEREEMEREAKLRELREREEKEREERMMGREEMVREEKLRERERLMKEDDLQRQLRQRPEETERHGVEEVSPEVVQEQAELLRFYEQRKQNEARKRVPQRGGPTSSYSSSIPGTSSYSAAFSTGAGRAMSSASSVYSSTSQRSSASSASASSAAPTDFSHASTASSASSTSTRPTTASTGSSSSGRTATGKPKPSPKPETYSGARSYSASGTSPTSAGGTAGSYTGSVPLSEEELRRRQEERFREQQRRFEQQKLQEDRDRAARVAGDSSVRVVDRWIALEREWDNIPNKDILFFHSIPWPLLKQPDGEAYHRKEGDSMIEEAQVFAFVTHPTLLAHLKTSDRDLAKKLLRRYHSDRFVTHVLSKVPENHKATVQKAANDVASALNKIKDAATASSMLF